MIPLAGGAGGRRLLGANKQANAEAKPRFDYLNFGGDSDSDDDKKEKNSDDDKKDKDSDDDKNEK